MRRISSAVAVVAAVLVLVTLAAYLVTPRNPGGQGSGPATPQGGQQPTGETSVQSVGSSYKIASGETSGTFHTGQKADMMLSGFGFDNAGGPLIFNHPGNVASDGTRLLLADRNNNRVLIWNSLPTGNSEPDLVLGHENFYSNNPGTGMDRMNWPIGISVAGGKVLVTDTYNDRVLIWNSFPTTSGQAADMELKTGIKWPWAVWTNGTKLVITSTGNSKILIWNSFPTSDREADISISIQNEIGTPRSIASDGSHLVIGDHNAFLTEQGTFFWKTFPTQNNQRYDFYVSDISTMGQPASQSVMGAQIWGPTMTSDGKLIGVANQVYIWNSFPTDNSDSPDISLGSSHPGAPGYDFGGSQSGDGSGVAVAGTRMYVSLSNGNKVVGFNSMPTSGEQIPDFAVGAENVYTNTLDTNYFQTNPAAATDGNSLFVISNFDSTLYVWKNIPDESGAKPDYTYNLNAPPNSIVIAENKLIVGSGSGFFFWDNLPLSGELPSTTSQIGGISFTGVIGLARDDKYFYVADASGKIYVWEGNPFSAPSSPAFTLNISGGALSSNGMYLAVADADIGPRFYRISDFPNPTALQVPGMRFNRPGTPLLYENKLFVPDTVSNRVQIWNSFDSAISGSPPDIILGQPNLGNTDPAIGEDRLFWPNTLAFDGDYLWVGEYKFSGRVMRFSPY